MFQNLFIFIRLGKFYDRDRDTIICDGCEKEIQISYPRYKAKFQKNLDLCKNCISLSKTPQNNFFYLENLVEDMVFHEYFECNICKAHPIPGIRFTCLICQSFDLCEACYDSAPLFDEKPHYLAHNFITYEIPLLAGGLPVHRLKCTGCSTFPIIGYCFTCTVCKQLQLCKYFYNFNKKVY